MTDTTDTGSDTLLDRTLGNLVVAWRDIAQSAARSVGLSARGEVVADPERLEAMMRECLQARGGEVSARGRAAELGETYLKLDADGRRHFLGILAEAFAVSHDDVDNAIDHYRAATDDAQRIAAEAELRQAMVAPRLRLLTQFNALPEGVKFLADLRADLLQIAKGNAYLQALDSDLFELLSSWFDTGFLDLRRITWDSSAALLEKLIAYEAVHEITSWQDLRNRLDSDRRLYGLFHPRMPKEPLAFVEVALVDGLAGSIQDLLGERRSATDPGRADTAIFYSISNTQPGLRGISFGDYLIKMVVAELARDLPQIKIFATLSPIPGFRGWLEVQSGELLDSQLSVEERGGLRALGGSDDSAEALAAILAQADWAADAVTAKALEGPLTRLCARYLLERRPDGTPLDSVARFHLRNGARIERLNWLGDRSDKGLRQSAGLMVNYRYQLDDIEKNHEAYLAKGSIVLGSEMRALVRRLKDDNGGSLRRLRAG